jgi:hypothetical protein
MLHSIVILAVLSAAGLGVPQNPCVGDWICDYSEESGVVVQLQMTETDWYVYAEAETEIVEMSGTYDFSENELTFNYEEGTIEGTYDPENDQISAYYEGVMYVFNRASGEE